MNTKVMTGVVSIWLDEIVPCLKDTETGEIKETVVFKIESRSFLKKFTEQNGWGINWIDVPKEVEVFALALKENNDIQGLVAVKKDADAKAAYLHWACTAPHNNKKNAKKPKYSGVGGHLFAVAVDKSMQWGFEGTVHGFALNKKLLNHYRVPLKITPKPLFTNKLTFTIFNLVTKRGFLYGPAQLFRPERQT